jgi:Kef-type K+ transport system membrane component KefB
VLHYDFELLGQISVLFGVAAIGGIVATYLNIPPHVGYLLGGALVGPSCLGIVRNYKEVETISLFGSIFLLFGHGAEYSLQKTDRFFQMYLLGGFAYIVTTVTLVAVVSTYIGWVSLHFTHSSSDHHQFCVWVISSLMMVVDIDFVLYSRCDHWYCCMFYNDCTIV